MCPEIWTKFSGDQDKVINYTKHQNVLYVFALLAVVPHSVSYVLAEVHR